MGDFGPLSPLLSFPMAYHEAQQYGGTWKWSELSLPTKVGLVILTAPITIGLVLVALPFLLFALVMQVVAQGPKATWREWKQTVRKLFNPAP